MSVQNVKLIVNAAVVEIFQSGQILPHPSPCCQDFWEDCDCGRKTTSSGKIRRSKIIIIWLNNIFPHWARTVDSEITCIGNPTWMSLSRAHSSTEGPPGPFNSIRLHQISNTRWDQSSKYTLILSIKIHESFPGELGDNVKKETPYLALWVNGFS